ADRNRSHWSTSKTPSYTKSVSWQHHQARALVDCYNNVYRLSLSPSIKRSAAIIKDAYIAITPDTSILHMASAYNTPVVAIYADYKTRWPAMADVSESVVVGQKIDNISLDEFAKALKSVLARI
ncbi:glycosyltransferase family 9 protein, partial [Escherichia coli]|uniref:glycosyltransferase family 9 protein n=1 Tax=Escherichia coli TaxID=562 RepID=UPI002559609B